MPDLVHICWDNSNIFIGSQFAAHKREAGFAQQNVRILFDNLLALARGGRNLSRAVCVGSVPPELRAVWDRLRALGLTVETYERGAGSGTEQGTGQCLQVHMLRALADVKPPQVAVLLTGDGAGYDEGAGFYADLERMAKCLWASNAIYCIVLRLLSPGPVLHAGYSPARAPVLDPTRSCGSRGGQRR
jgi:hypothetical protein